MTRILTLTPEKGGITELLCDMDECHHVLGRGHFDPIPDPMPAPIPDWTPSEDHFPRTKEAGGRRTPGNIRLAHRGCNRDDYGTGDGNEKKRQRARDDKAQWLVGHPEQAVLNEEAERRWEASRRTTRFPNLETVAISTIEEVDATVRGGAWLYVWRPRVGDALVIGTSSDLDEVRRSNPREADAARSRSASLVVIGPLMADPDADGQRRLQNELSAQVAALAGLLASRSYEVFCDPLATTVYDRGLFERVRSLVDPHFGW